MPDNAPPENPGDCSSKDVDKHINEALGKGNIKDTRLSKMALVALNYRIRKAVESHTARSLPSDREVVAKYNWILSSLLQGGEITGDTSFSELIRILEKSSTMKRMLCFGHVLAKNIYEDLLYCWRTEAERAKRHKHSENGGTDTKCVGKDTKECADDEKEEGEI